MITEPFFFYSWWLIINGCTHYLELHFLLCIANRPDRSSIIPWLIITSGLTLFSTRNHVSGMFFFHMVLLLLFAKYILRLSWNTISAPIAILFTLHTFLEGFSALILSYLSSNLILDEKWTVIQIFLSALPPLLLFVLLSCIKRKYSTALWHPLSSCLYILLLPCAFLVLSIRYGLRLDTPGFASYLSSFGKNAAYTILFLMTAAFLLFLLILSVFGKMIALTEQNQTMALLSKELEGQKAYIQEAEKRQEQYASFRHDLDNHLLVLTGFLQEENYKEARKYAKKLYKKNHSFLISPDAGSPALNVLLREKLSFAKQNGIEVQCHVRVPKTFFADPMDLCVIFSNLLDNAIHACMNESSENRHLSISTRTKAHFLVIEETNTTSFSSPVTPGIGLRNIQILAEKYQGAVEFEKENGRFRITVLLCSPIRPSAKQ